MRELFSKHALFFVDDSFPPVDVYDLVLVYVLEYVWCVHEDAHCAHRGHDEEDVQLQAVDHHRHELPVLSDLKMKEKTVYVGLQCCCIVVLSDSENTALYTVFFTPFFLSE